MSINRVTLVGYVGKEPEIRYIDKERCVANFSLATSEGGYTTASGVELPERTQWHALVAWQPLSFFVEKHIHKGAHLLVEGKLCYRNWVDAAGVSRYVAEINLESIEMLSAITSQVSPPKDTPTTYTSPVDLGDHRPLPSNNEEDPLPF